MSLKLQLELQSRAKRRRAEEDILRKRKEAEAATTPGQILLYTPPLTDNVKSPSISSTALKEPSPSLLSIKKRPRFWKTPTSTSNNKPIHSKWLDNEGDPVPEKPSPKFRKKSRLSLDDSSSNSDNEGVVDDCSDFSKTVTKPSTTTLSRRIRYSLGDSSQEETTAVAKTAVTSARKPVSVRRPPPPATPHDSDDTDDSFGMEELRVFRLRQQQRKQGAAAVAQQTETLPSKQKGTSLHQSTKSEKNVRKSLDDCIEEEDINDASTIGCDPPTRAKAPAYVLNRTRFIDNGRESSSSSSEDEAEPEKRGPRPAHNPIALMKRQDEEIKASLARMPAGPVATDRQYDALWDSDPEPDSEEEPNKASPQKKRKPSSLASGKRKSSGRSSGTGGSKPPKQRSGRASHGFWDDNSVLDSRGHLLLDWTEQELAEQLHPDGLANRVFMNMDGKPLVLDNGDQRYEVPASLTRYLADYQREGVEFMFGCLGQNMGCILADDMGLGKTVQVLSLLSALFGKSGTGLDVSKMRHRQQLVKAAMEEQKQLERDSLMRGMLEQPMMNPNLSRERVQELGLPERWWPVMIAVPPSVLTNWQQEIDKWTNISVAVYSDPDTREKAISQITSGMAEVMLIKNSFFTAKGRFRELCTIPVKWRLIVFDEFHTFKNKDATAVANIRQLKTMNQSLVVGMSGTVMQNHHQELWNLVDLVETNFLGDWNEFKYEVADPIKLGRAKSATPDLISISDAKASALQKKLRRIMIERKKEHVLKEFLPSKNEKVVMCELSSMQRDVYEHILNLPEIDYVRKASSPCDCGVNRGFFQHLHRLRLQSERVAYVREQQNNLVKRRECCYEVPLNPDYVEGGSEPRIHPDAVIWRSMKGHAGDTPCDLCPTCCGFPVLAKLYKLGNHLALLQAKKTRSADEVGHPENIEYKKQLAFARVALPSVAEKLSGGYNLKDGIMDDHFALSGKLKVLDKLLAMFWKDNSKALLFSYSTQTLDLIQNYLKAKGQYEYLRMDGSTDSRQRQGLADRFNHDPSKFIFLLSTRAMGVGLNLTAASKVVIFDVEWNPSNDEQAQDRAYRIGQTQNVEVFRLVAQGTIDEMKYLRQLYKVQLKQETFAEKSSEPKAARIFTGVEGDKHRKGELFGYENLFRFKDGSFLNDIWKASGKQISKRRKGDLVIHDASKISDALLGIELGKLGDVLEGVNAYSKGQSNFLEITGVPDKTKSTVKEGDEQEVENPDADAGGIEAFDHGDLFREDRGGAAVEVGDEGFDEEMGGQTQNVFEIFERGVVMGDDNPQDGSSEVGGLDGDEDGVVADPDTSVHVDDDTSDREESISEPVAAMVVAPEPRAFQLPPLHAKRSDKTPKWKFEEPEWIVRSPSEDSDGKNEFSVAHVDSKKEAFESKHHSEFNTHTPQFKKSADTEMSTTGEAPGSDDGADNILPVSRVGSSASTQLYPPVAPKVNLFGTPSSNHTGAATDFSTSDLFLPTYKKKSKRKKK